MLKEINKAFQLIERGKINDAENILNEISATKTDDPEIITQMGRLAFVLGEDVFAAYSFSRVIEIQPENAYVKYLLARVYFKSGRPSPALKLCNEAIEINPNLEGPYIILGQEAAERSDYVRSVEYLEKAIQLKPSEPFAYREIISSLRELDRYEEALKYAEKFLRLQPIAVNYIPISRVLVELGRMVEATSYLEKALRIDSTCGYVYNELAVIKKFSLDDNELIKKAEKALLQSLPALQRSLIHFSLGKIYNDLKEWDKAFEHYKQGNLVGKAGVEPTALYERTDDAKKAYSKKRLKQEDLFGSDSDVPVFIVGMPRSGTTLTEQIIASHPDAEGAGELSEIIKIHAIVCGAGNLSSKELDKKLSKENLVKYAADYLQVLCKGREGAIRIVDKMPDNFMFLGLIHMLFPKARIIHVARNPLDTCLSCYFQAFASVPETYDLDWLVKRYRFYRKTMSYWKRMLPEGAILDIKYEELIEDPELQSRRIIEFCELPWDDSCLDFHRKKRAISTASVWQARQPIYTSSRKRWHNYAPYIEKLVSGLGDYLDEEDIAELRERGIKVKNKRGFGILNFSKK